MNKLINAVADVVPEALQGLLRLNPNLMLLRDEMVVLRTVEPGEVALISGGGAGHEPAHAGYVGPGLLHAAVSGDVFTSPSADAVLAAIRAVDSGAGVLLIVKSYTGDRLNFGLAAEIARGDGIPVEMVVVGDDAALAAGGAHAGRRGLAGTLFVHKIAGAAAAAGLPLSEVKAAAERAAASTATIGVGLSGCTVPGARQPAHAMAPDEIEMGLGIHGEPGVRRGPLRPAASLAEEMLKTVADDLGLRPGDQAALIVNNLGATPAAELAIFTNDVLRVAEDIGLQVVRCWSGSFLTALDMAGCSVSLLRLDPQQLLWLDAPASSAAWPGPAAVPHAVTYVDAAPVTRDSPPAFSNPAQPYLEACVRAAMSALQEAEPYLTELDQAVGDGDIGFSLKRGADAILSSLPSCDFGDPADTLARMAAIIRRAIGGTSGPLYAIFLLRGAAVLRQKREGGLAWPEAWSAALEAGWRAISELGQAVPGDRTMLDALSPAATALAEAIEAGNVAEAPSRMAEAAGRGAAATQALVPRRGRSSYLADRVSDHPDPGAEAVAIWMRAVAQVLADSSPSPDAATTRSP